MHHRSTTRLPLRALAAPLLLALLGACAALGGKPKPGPESPAETPPAEPVIRPDGKYVVVDVETNELLFMDGDRVLWRAPVGTGTGFRLARGDDEWHFTTPSGTMHVQFKELNPTWLIPDWYFIENKLPVPPANSPRRRQPGGLGAAAVYLGNEIAIHGTDKPELLGKRVSHGCIRLSNTNAIRLYHDVQVGTPVLIRGHAEVLEESMPDSASRFTRSRGGGRTQPYVNPRDRVRTADLLRRLDRELAAPDTANGWVLTASSLIERGLREDSLALRGVLARAGTARDEARKREYDNFVADVFARGSFRAAVSLSKIGEEERERAAEAIVRATMDLYHGPLSPQAPWPTNRVPKWRLGPLGQSGWVALQQAEERYRAARPGRLPAVRSGAR
jgi:lipoprotein-anchoring transpeptidase ErfK/SrfK